MQILEQVNIQPHVTLATPSVAKYYCEVTSQACLLEALRWAKRHKEQVFVLGGGSNVLPRDVLNGLVLHIKLLGKVVVDSFGCDVEVQFSAGENWHESVMWALSNNYYGLENLALIPGTLGAAPIQNIGAYGVELADRFKCLTAIDIETLEEKIFTKDECAFGYRDSVFKNAARNKYVITSVTLCLSLSPQLKVEYPALRQVVENNWPKKRGAFNLALITPQDIADAVVSVRQSKLPDPAFIPNVGSFFKNPVVHNATVDLLRKKWPDIVVFEVDAETKKVPAGWLIDRLGWKGKDVGGVIVHPLQALVLTNPNKQLSTSVLNAAKVIQQDVELQCGILLEIEPQLLG